MIVDTYRPQAGVALASPLITHLAGAFNREQVEYAHWKSNMHLVEQTAGDDGDFDFLVARRSLPAALAILSQSGFKAAVAHRGANSPGIGHYYGLDETTGQLVHVHLFSVVLTGESLVKSHLLPLEAMLLQNASYWGPIRVTARRAELVIFTLRTFVKYGSLPDLLALWRKADDLRQELLWLRAGDMLPAALSLLAQHCPQIDEQLFLRCIQALHGQHSLLRRIVLARQVRRRLRVYARHNYLGRLVAYAQLGAVEVQRRLGGKRKNKALQAGGAVIAFVGAEATGKSTLVAETARWLGGAFAVRTVHAGKPPATLLTAPVSLLLPLLRRGFSSLRTNRLEGHSRSDRDPPPADRHQGPASLVYALRAVILAWERRQLLLRARRAAANGDLVICDRYPSETVGAMDSPRLTEQTDTQGFMPALVNRLARLEHRLYRQIPPPDIALRLTVDLETALQRNRTRLKEGKENEAYVVSRHRQARAWHKQGTKYVYDIDTGRLLAETIVLVKNAIWESL